MPLALDPHETFDVVLPSDRDRPEPRPTFRFRHLTARTARRLRAVLRMPAEAFAADAEALIGEVWRILEAGCVGWSDMAAPDGLSACGDAQAGLASPAIAPGGHVPFAPGTLDAVLTEREIWALAMAVLAGAGPTDLEKKGLGSPSPSDGAASAPDAPAAGA